MLEVQIEGSGMVAVTVRGELDRDQSPGFRTAEAVDMRGRWTRLTGSPAGSPSLHIEEVP